MGSGDAMMRMKSILWALLLSGLILPSSPGRVFRANGVRKGQLNTAGLPWELAYRTTMAVNGRRNSVHVYSARFHEPVAEQLKSQFQRQGAKVVLHRTAESTVGVATWPDREARVLILSPDSQPNQMVFLFYPEVRDAGKTRLPIPEYPGGKMGNMAHNEETNTLCATLETTDPIEQVISFYTGVLTADGWYPALPQTRSRDAVSKLTIFHKRNKMCCILAKNGPDGLNRITLLVKGEGL